MINCHVMWFQPHLCCFRTMYLLTRHLFERWFSETGFQELSHPPYSPDLARVTSTCFPIWEYSSVGSTSRMTVNSDSDRRVAIGARRNTWLQHHREALWTLSSDRASIVDPLSYFSLQSVLNDWCNKGRGMCYPVHGMVHIKEPLLLIGKSSSCGGSGFPLSLSEWSFTICPTPYNR